MENAIIYIHGKGGNAKEAAHYRPFFHDCDVIGFPDTVFQSHRSVSVIANSIGAFFAMSALPEKRIKCAYFISPVVDMERLIMDMMGWANVTEEELRQQKEIQTPFGETLSWAYLCYVRKHPSGRSQHIFFTERRTT